MSGVWRERVQRFGWEHFGKYNADVKRAVGQAPELCLLDVVPMSILRPDAHIVARDDCLHWKYPGVIDDWNRLLATELPRCRMAMSSL